MRITITIEGDAPEGFNTHNLLRDMVRNASYRLSKISVVRFGEQDVEVIGEPAAGAIHEVDGTPF